jgi:hypothetical protein
MRVVAIAMSAFFAELSAALDLRFPFTAEQLRDVVQRWRHSRIDLVPYRMGKAEVYGLCKCVRPRHYVIFYRCDGTTYIQQQRIIFHELCHIILSHVSPLNPIHALRDDLTVTLQDQEAEIFAEIANRHALALGSKLRVTKAPLPNREGHDTLDYALADAASMSDSEPAQTDRFNAFLKTMGGQG